MAEYRVEELAAEAGVEVVESELVGLLPEAALAGVDPWRLKLAGFSRDRLVEERVRQAMRRRSQPSR